MNRGLLLDRELTLIYKKEQILASVGRLPEMPVLFITNLIAGAVRKLRKR